MVFKSELLVAFVCLNTVLAALSDRAADPCAVIAGKKWVAPQAVRACYSSIMVDPVVKTNIIDVIEKSLAFHTSVNYQIKAPEPFTADVHEDILADIEEYRNTNFNSDYDLHITLSRALKRLNDGHCTWINRCYDCVYSTAFINYLPIPLVLLTEPDGTQNVYIAPEAFAVASVEFADEIQLWQDSLGSLQLESLPYRSRIGAINAFTNTSTYLANNCAAVTGTNGIDYYASPAANSVERPVAKFQQQPAIPAAVVRKHHLNVILDDIPMSDIVLPPTLVPSLPAVNGSRSVAQFYLLDDEKTGVLALGSFSDSDYLAFLNGLLEGLFSLKSKNATQLIVDVTNNGGGFICAAHWLHRIIVGPKSTTVPQAGLDTETRDGPLAQLIVKQLVSGNVSDPNLDLLYNPLHWVNASNIPFAANNDWLQPPVEKVINGNQDAFSQRYAKTLDIICDIPQFGVDWVRSVSRVGSLMALRNLPFSTLRRWSSYQMAGNAGLALFRNSYSLHQPDAQALVLCSA
ncbi:hypothetical protein C0993_010563 [Termitomyces sp. T159_Od127]|nr:hypothetical protein C0993_010563 [Termitomyces sp. T159_Od127]